MKSKLLAFCLTLALAVVSAAQTSTPATPSNLAQDTKACACCNHETEGGAKSGCADCCKGGKCPMMFGSHAGMKCPMMAKDEKPADGKMCCSSNKCPMYAQGSKCSGCCCCNMDGQKPAA